MANIKKRNQLIIIILISILFFKSISCQKKDYGNNYNSYNLRKNKALNKSSKNFFSRKLDGEEESLCDGWLNDEDNFHDLNIYIDLSNIEEELENKPYKNLLINSINKAKGILESILKIFQGTDPFLSNSDIISEFEISKWNEELIGDALTERAKGMFYQGYSYIIWFKYASTDSDLGDEITLAKPVILDEACGQPEVGIITLRPNYDYSQLSQDYFERYMLHQLTHLLVFDDKVLSGSDFEDIFLEEEIEEHKYKYYIKSNKVTNFAKKYFDCDGITKLEIIKEENGNLHWPSRLLLGEYMTDFVYPEEQIISQFTLSLFEDVRYLKLKNKYTGGLMRFGKHKGCNFINKKCIGEGQFENEFYYPESQNINEVYTEPSCSSGRLSKTVHILKKYEEDIPSPYFIEYPLLGGLKSANYCPVSVSNLENLNLGYCSNTNNIPNEERGESFSSNSFCALSSLINENVINYLSKSEEIKAICFKMFCSEESLTIKVGENYFVCPREGGKIEGVKFAGFLLCPDYNLICTGKELKLCNNIFNCLADSVEENENSYTYNYDIKTTQVSSVYNSDTYKDYGYELTTNGICPQNCMQCKENKICVQCRPNYGLIGSTNSQEINCDLLTNLENRHYVLDTVYYPCIENCYQCENGNTCNICDTNFKLNNGNICIPKVENCLEYNPDETCKKCINNDFALVKINEEKLCKRLSEIDNTFYEETNDDLTYYIKCSEAINNCERCTSSTNCIKCFHNYLVMDNDASKCEDLSKYYFDSQESKFKLCSTQINKCEKCSILTNNKIKCNKCEENYVLINTETPECILKTSIENNQNYFSVDEGKNYYLCSDNEHHLVYGCLTCLNQETCESCQSGYNLYNAKTLCLSNIDINDRLYYRDPRDNNYYLCSKQINGCNKCNDGNNCTDCLNEYGLDNNNKCIHSSILATKYYLDPTTGKYSSCSTISNCEECTSSTQCNKCQTGYILNNNICELNENKDNDKVKAMATAGVVLGTLSMAISIGILLLFLIKKIFVKNNIPDMQNIINNEEIKPTDAVIIQSNRRSIHNEKN